MSEQREDMTERDDLPGEVPAAADDAAGSVGAEESAAPTGKYGKLLSEESGVRKLTGMYRNWFLDYASYVILERAVPHVQDGLKPVQRRILHAMKAVDDGRYNKVANIVGQTMQYHPHGDASIKDALVQLGQKDLLIDCQGNWGNILTGDEAAAGRYIEARLSKFALDVVFNKKTTEWMRSYDGRNEEPVTLPVKFPLLLAQGADGIAVGLASKILPHNFIELINAAIAHLQGRNFVLYPDFPTGGMIDVSRYNDGLRGGTVKVRAAFRRSTSGRWPSPRFPTPRPPSLSRIRSSRPTRRERSRSARWTTIRPRRSKSSCRSRPTSRRTRPSTRSTLLRTAKCRSPRMPA